MDGTAERWTATRRALHAVAESVIAGPQYRSAGTVRLRVTPGGFGGAVADLRVEGADLVWADGRVPLSGTCRQLADAAGVQVGPPEGVYADGAGVGPDEAFVVDPAAAADLADWFARGDAALRRFGDPVLWPEHFDLGVTVDRINYGISPGDAAHPAPYAYVGPWEPRTGPFWNARFGALRAASELPDAEALAAFLAAGRAAAEQDPVAAG
ncbi:hypothetical protein ACL02T_03385 [Pseudonocardia sp. RS010]|uniref:hypothetical protein n=1 Tax=Pseudonocardia sp. RS010 TaxID=3385979 RepID=UPI0039A20C66